MPNEISQDGSFNIGIQNVTNSPINVTQVLGKSLEYKDLLNQLQTQQKLFSRTPEAETQERLEISQAIAQLEPIIEQFKKDVTQLAAEFDRIEINTDRLRRAKEHFEKGEIAAARAVFDSEREQMQDENDRLVEKKPCIEQWLQMLKHNSDEFYLSALLERTAYENPNWLNDTCDYFERSIKVFATEDNVFQYAFFLKNHNRFDQAEIFYQQFLDEFVGGDVSKRAMTLNNLANLHCAKNELAQTALKYLEALEIYRKLAAVTPSVYLPFVATTLNNLANLHTTKNDLSLAETEYFEALEIQRKLAAVNPSTYLPDVAETLNNLAILHKTKNNLPLGEAEYLEALKIQRKLATVNPATYLPFVATTLNNLANLHKTKNDLPLAEAGYFAALEIRRNLAAVNPIIYLPGVATTLNNLANLHKTKNDLPLAEAEYFEALEIQRKLAAVNPATYLPDMATMLNNLANLHCAKNDLPLAEAEYLEALEIYRKLAAVNPATYLRFVATTLNNLAIYHLQSVPNRERSVNYLLEAVMILLPMVEAVPYTQNYLQTAIEILVQGWGLSAEEIQQMLAEK